MTIREAGGNSATRRDLVDVVTGRRPADLVIRGGRWVNVCSGEILPDSDIAVLEGRIAYCGPDAGAMIGPESRVIDADGCFLVPGLLDAHVHVESAMLAVTRFAEAVLPHGTTTVFIDPHEIANVLGLRGVRLMHDEGARTALRVYVQVPSCVPASPHLETAGGAIAPADVAEALGWPNVIGLGEVMNFPGVIAGDEVLHDEIATTIAVGGVVGGHYASPDLGAAFHAYAAAGPRDCHEGTRVEDAVARLRQGMAAMLRQGSAWQDVAAQLPAITERGLDPRHVLLCTDDRHSGTLLRDGHMDDVVRLAVREGVPPVTAIQMATLNTAEHFGVAGEVGCLAPGRSADILLVDDLERLSVDVVIASGAIVAERGGLTMTLPDAELPDWARNTVRLAAPLRAADFRIPAPVDAGTIDAHVIGVVENQATTCRTVRTIAVREGAAEPAGGADLARLAVVERHHGSGRIGLGLVSGFGLRGGCGLASTVAHDSHNLLILGTDPAAMAIAGNRVAELGGGIALVRGETVLVDLSLPLAGLMSDRPAEEVACRADALHEALQECGCPLHNAFMTFSLLALPVIPALRLTDLGLVDVAAQAIVPLWVDG